MLNFLDYTRSAFLIHVLEKYEKSIRKKMSLQSKTYIIDIGIARLFSDIDKGRALENAVFLEILRKKGPTQSINYLKLKSGKEVDFIISGKTKEIIQVSYQLSDALTKSKEISALVAAAKGLGLDEARIITYNFEGEEVFDGVLIKYIPFWVWALPNMQ